MYFEEEKVIGIFTFSSAELDPCHIGILIFKTQCIELHSSFK